MKEKHNFHSYACFRRNKRGILTGILYGSDLESLKLQLSKPKIPISEQNVNNEKEIEKKDIQKDLNKAMFRVVDMANSQSALLSMSATFRLVYLGFNIEKEFVSIVENSSHVVENFSEYNIYGVSKELFDKLSPHIDRVDTAKKGLDALPSALLMSIVATFDSNLADIVRDMFTLKSNFFRSAKKTISLNEVFQASSVEEIREKIVSDEIYQFSRGSHEEQVQYIQENFHINIMNHWKRWPDFIEVFERRNLIAHGEKKFTKRYMEICQKHGHKGSDKTLDEVVKLTDGYLSQAVDVLSEFSILLIFSLWRKHFPDQEKHAFEIINHISYKFIENKAYTVPIRLLEYAITIKSSNFQESLKRMMYVNLASAYKHFDKKDEKKFLEIINKDIWASSSDNYKICIESLKENLMEVTRLMPLVVSSKTLDKSDFRRWPVFDFVRENKADRSLIGALKSISFWSAERCRGHGSLRGRLAAP